MLLMLSCCIWSRISFEHDGHLSGISVSFSDINISPHEVHFNFWKPNIPIKLQSTPYLINLRVRHAKELLHSSGFDGVACLEPSKSAVSYFMICPYSLFLRTIDLTYLKTTIAVIAFTLPSIAWPRMNKLTAVSHKARPYNKFWSWRGAKYDINM